MDHQSLIKPDIIQIIMLAMIASVLSWTVWLVSVGVL